jgi:hypothetical protein
LRLIGVDPNSRDGPGCLFAGRSGSAEPLRPKLSAVHDVPGRLSYLHIPLDLAVVDEWARLRDLSESNAWNVSDNDLWIAATASARGFPLVTCDRGQARIADPALEIIYLPPNP